MANALSFRFPVFHKELMEMALRRRTYFVRTAYASLLFYFFLVQFDGTFSSLRGAGAAELLGQMGKGRGLFQSIVMMQFIGIYLLLPAFMAPAVAKEKEDGSFALLRISRMSSWQILLQKLGGRLVPMLTFLLLSLPLLSVAYALGGVVESEVLEAIVVLLLTCLQIGALSLLMSVLCPTMVSATLWCYLVYAVFAAWLTYYVANSAPQADNLMAFAGVSTFYSNKGSGVPVILAKSWPLALSTIILLILARVFIARSRAPRRLSTLKGMFGMMDRIMERINASIGRGIVILKDSSLLLERAPIAWREMGRAGLSQPRNLVRLMLCLEIPAVLIPFMTGFHPASIVVAISLLWVLGLVLVCVHCANLIGSERSKQTLSILLTTPIWAADVVLQKMWSMRRIVGVLLVPFGTLFLLHMVAHAYPIDPSIGYGRWGLDGFDVYLLIVSFAAVLVYLHLAGWTACLIGMRIRNRAYAVLAALFVIAGWFVLTFPLLTVIFDFELSMNALALVCPVAVIILTMEYDSDLWMVGAAINVCLHWLLMKRIRKKALENAERHLMT